MLPRLEITQTLRPVDLVSAAAPARSSDSPGTSTLFALPRPAPYAAVTAALRHRPHRTELCFSSMRLAGILGISPAAKPIIRCRPFRARLRTAGSVNLSPTGS